MLVDLTLKITPQMVQEAQGNEKKALVGHLGTHFDIMNKEFPLEYTERAGLVFDVRHVKERDIDIKDIQVERIQKDSFVCFYTGFIEEINYGTKEYFSTHPQLSHELIDLLIQKGVSLIGVDFAGVRRGKEHPLKDQYCADQGVFIIENLCHLNDLVQYEHYRISTYPMNYSEMSGLPCRVIAHIE